MLAILGGSELLQLPAFQIQQRRIIRTPYGQPSSPVIFTQVGHTPLLFLIRHGYGRYLNPNEINYRANICALQEAGAKHIIAVSTVYGLHPDMSAEHLVAPHDIIDYTSGRAHTFYENSDNPFVHTPFDEPYSHDLRSRITHAFEQLKIPYHHQAVYAAVNGPRLPSQAEAMRYKHDGADILGMTGMPEAILAREKGIHYAHVCAVMQSLPLANNTISAQDAHQQNLADIQKLLAHLAQ